VVFILFSTDAVELLSPSTPLRAFLLAIEMQDVGQ